MEKIISGGQTGADQAALDAAMKFNIDYGGWVPKGRKTEHGKLKTKYKMDEMQSNDYPARTRQNIIDSDATLIISGPVLKGGSLLTKKLARELGKPYCHIDYIGMDDFEASMLVHSFVVDNKVNVLNIAGPRISSDSTIYEATRNIVESLIYMVELASGKGVEKLEYALSDKSIELLPSKCNSKEQLIQLLSSKLTLRTKTMIASVDDSKIASLYFELYDYIMDNLTFSSGEKTLLSQYSMCISANSNDDWKLNGVTSLIKTGDLIMVIVKELKKHLEKDHILRIVK